MVAGKRPLARNPDSWNNTLDISGRFWLEQKIVAGFTPKIRLLRQISYGKRGISF
jgi:hypothetical protein